MSTRAVRRVRQALLLTAASARAAGLGKMSWLGRSA
jgi:hypothetical protein